MIGFITQAAILFLILYEEPILGNMESRAHLALATAVAVIGSTALSLLWDALSAPKRVHLALIDQHENEPKTIENVFNASSTLDALSAIYEEGMTAYSTYADPNCYFRAMDYWVERADKFVETNLSARELFLFRQSKHRFMGGAPLKDADPEWLQITNKKRGEYSGRLANLKHVLEYPALFYTIDFGAAKEVIRTGRELSVKYRV